MKLLHLSYNRVTLAGPLALKARVEVPHGEPLLALRSWCTTHGIHVDESPRRLMLPTNHICMLWLKTTEQQVAFKLRWWDGSIHWPQERA